MAAANIHPGDSILAIGETGKTLITSFTKFITYRKVHDRRLENLYATLSLTANTLTDLGTTLNKYENDFRIKDEVTGPICETAKVNLERFLVMVNEGISSGVWKNDGTIGGQSITAEVDPWFLITMALGGRDEAKLFWSSLDDTRDTLLELHDIVKYRILKSLSDKNALTPEQTEEFNHLTSLLPHLIQSLEKAEKGRKLETEAAAKKEKEKEEEAERESAAAMPGLSRRDSTLSDLTLIVEPTRRNVLVDKDIDCQSISSVSSSDSGSFVDTPEVYEEWQFRWNEPVKNVSRSSSFLGIKFKSYYEDTGFWDIDSEYRTQGEMKEQHQFAAADLSTTKHKEAMQKAIQAVPKKFGYEVDALLEDRTLASSHEEAKRHWTVVSVRPQQKYPYGSAKKWGKDPAYTNWLVTIKGETVDKVERSRALTRRDDPWRRQRSYSRSRSPPRRYPIIQSGPRNPRGAVRLPMPMPRPPYRPGPRGPLPPVFRREAVPDDGYRLGTLVVGNILSKEEAVKKMDEIWKDMTAAKQPVETNISTD